MSPSAQERPVQEQRAKIAVPIINPDPEAAAVGPMRGFQNNKARKRKFEDIATNSTNSYPRQQDHESDNEKREYCTVESEDWLVPFSRKPDIEADDLHKICKQIFKLNIAPLTCCSGKE
jgi:hypothetical protein